VYKLLHLLLGIDESEITINSNVFPNELLHENAPSAIGLVGSDETSSLSNEENDDNISDLLNAKDSINHTKNDEVLSAFNENDLKKLFQGENSDYIISGKEIEANYVGQLLELCAQKKGWNLPEYEFRIKGKANEPVIFCKCKLVAPTEIFEETAVSTNKKSAKHEAARKIIDKIYKLPVVESNVEYDLNDIDGKSNISKLMELCTKMKIDLPSFDYNQRGTLHQPSFECTLSIRWNKEFYKFNGSGATKKEAKQMAAGNCIEKLKLDSLD
jgi:dsRNA-specific ribonuclease